jgi:hypothetical protein
MSPEPAPCSPFAPDGGDESCMQVKGVLQLVRWVQREIFLPERALASSFP